VQVVKIVFPVYYGAKYQCEKVPQHAVMRALRSQQAEANMKAQAEAKAQTEVKALAEAVGSNAGKRAA
jgi:hypothetical protein